MSGTESEYMRGECRRERCRRAGLEVPALSQTSRLKTGSFMVVMRPEHNQIPDDTMRHMARRGTRPSARSDERVVLGRAPGRRSTQRERGGPNGPPRSYADRLCPA